MHRSRLFQLGNRVGEFCRKSKICAHLLLTCGRWGGKLFRKNTPKHDDENQYISQGFPRELPVGARQWMPGMEFLSEWLC